MYDYLKSVGQSSLGKYDTIKKISAKVLSAGLNSTNATIQPLDKAQTSITLYNKTGEILEVGDMVWVYYWHVITDGYIALRCGEPNYAEGISDNNSTTYTGTLPVHQKTSIDTSYVLTENTKEYRTTYEYEVSDQSSSGIIVSAYTGSISSTWSADFNHNVYMSSCTMFNNSELHFAWVPNRVGTGSSASAVANLHVYSDITVPEIVNNQIINRRYYVKATLQSGSNDRYLVEIAMVENGQETILTILGDGVPYESIQNCRFMFYVGSTDTDEDNAGHMIRYNPYLSVASVDTIMFQAYYDQATGLWGIMRTYTTWERNCIVACKQNNISKGIYKNLVTQTKERSEVI